MNKKQIKIIEEGVVVPGKITSCKYSPYAHDREYTEFLIDYSYKYKEKLYEGYIDLYINTDHVDYAHSGGLIGFSKVDFTRDDVINALKEGTEIKICILPKKPEDHLPQFDEIVHQALEF